MNWILGYLAGLVDNRLPGPWSIRRPLRDALLNLTIDGGRAGDGFDAGVGDHG